VALMAYLLRIRFDDAGSLNQTPFINFTFALCLAMFLLADLVIFTATIFAKRADGVASVC